MRATIRHDFCCCNSLHSRDRNKNETHNADFSTIKTEKSSKFLTNSLSYHELLYGHWRPFQSNITWHRAAMLAYNFTMYSSVVAACSCLTRISNAFSVLTVPRRSARRSSRCWRSLKYSRPAAVPSVSLQLSPGVEDDDAPLRIGAVTLEERWSGGFTLVHSVLLTRNTHKTSNIDTKHTQNIRKINHKDIHKIEHKEFHLRCEMSSKAMETITDSV